MKIFVAFLFLALLGSHAVSQEQPSPFPTCESAYNYGRTTIEVNANTVYNRIGCTAEQQILDTAEALFTRILKNLVFNYDFKKCYYSGVADGINAATDRAYQKCSNVVIFKCVKPATYARYSSSLFVAMYKSFGGDLDQGTISEIFSQKKMTHRCKDIDISACREHIDTNLNGENSVNNVPQSMTKMLKDAVCGPLPIEDPISPPPPLPPPPPIEEESSGCS
jgi:hypothetical protein